MNIKFFFALYSPFFLFSLVQGTIIFRKPNSNASVISKCVNPSWTFLYKGLQYKDIIDTYESEPSFLVSLEDLSSKKMKNKFLSMDKTRVTLVLSLEAPDVKKLLTGPFRTSPVKEEEVKGVISIFAKQTGSPLKYLLVPHRTPVTIIKILRDLKLGIIYRSGTVDDNTDLNSFRLRDFIVADLSDKGGFNFIMKMGEYLDETGNDLFSLKECLNITPPGRAQNEGGLMSLDDKLAKMRTFVVPSRVYYVAVHHMELRRNNILEDSLAIWRGMLVENFIKQFVVKFKDESGIDAGGLTKEWANLISAEGFGSSSKYFEEIKAEENFVIPKSVSVPQTEPDLSNYLINYIFLGSFLAKILLNGNTSESNFPNFLIKLLMGKKPNFHDLKQFDPDLFKNLKTYVAETDQNNGSFEFSYSRETEDRSLETVYFKTDSRGNVIKVTEENKFEYLKLYFYSKVFTHQIESFVHGFRETIAVQKMPFGIFKVNEMRLFITGSPTINLEDWKNNSIYEGYNSGSRVIVWFWEIVETFDDEKRRKLLKWVTGCRNAPLQGFAQMLGSGGAVYKFKITKHGDNRYWPASHTCFNTIDLPEYSSKALMIEKLEYAMKNETFGRA